jgi:hypothetical protein
MAQPSCPAEALEIEILPPEPRSDAAAILCDWCLQNKPAFFFDEDFCGVCIDCLES